MSKEIPSLFKNTKLLETRIDEFLDKVSEGAIYFEMGFAHYMEHGYVTEVCREKLRQILALKERCNELRRFIATVLYTEMLIPESRGDVLSLLSDLFNLIDVMADNLQELIIEHPKRTAHNFIEDYLEDSEALLSVSIEAVETVISAARAFFRNPPAVRDYIHKVYVFESEADKIGVRLKQKIFSSDLSFEQKIQMRDAINIVDELADKAENVSDQLSIYTIKRAL